MLFLPPKCIFALLHLFFTFLVHVSIPFCPNWTLSSSLFITSFAKSLNGQRPATINIYTKFRNKWPRNEVSFCTNQSFQQWMPGGLPRRHKSNAQYKDIFQMWLLRHSNVRYQWWSSNMNIICCFIRTNVFKKDSVFCHKKFLESTNLTKRIRYYSFRDK